LLSGSLCRTSDDAGSASYAATLDSFAAASSGRRILKYIMYEAKPIAPIMKTMPEDVDRIRIHSGTIVRCIDVPYRYSSDYTSKARFCWLISDVTSSSCSVFTGKCLSTWSCLSFVIVGTFSGR
jgi:hypothetical protein